MNPEISVIVPVYNNEKYVGQCLESLINQSLSSIEFIVIDDGSTDESGNICDLYATKDKRITVIHKENDGLVSSRKKGLSLAKGTYIGYVDGDDWVEEDFFKNMYENITKNHADIVITGFKRDLFEKTDLLLNQIKPGLYSGKSLDELKCNSLSSPFFFSHGIYTFFWNKLFRKDLIAKHQHKVYDSIIIGEDAAVVYPAIFDSNVVYVSDDCLYHYRQREGSLLKRKYSFPYEVSQVKNICHYLFHELKEYHSQYNFLNQIKDYIVWLYIFRLFGDLELYDKNSIMMPYVHNFIGKKIVLYCAGNYGQQLFKRLLSSGYCTIVKWVDVDYKLYRRMGLDVDSDINFQTDTIYDYVVVASLDSKQSESIKRELVCSGIDENKISILDVSKKQSLFKQCIHLIEEGQVE